MDVDCSIPAVIFTYGYTLINLALFGSTIYTLYKFCKHYKENIQKNTPKLLFYCGFMFFISSLIMVLVAVRNSMFICFHGTLNHLDVTHWIYFIIFYFVQTYLLWLVLFLRLKYVFDGSAYCLSTCTIKTYVIIFIFIPFTTPIYLIILWFVQDTVYTVILLFSFVFIISFSCSLLFTFVYKLFQVFKSMDIDRCINKESMLNNKLLSTITKSTILAVFSLAMTICTPISLLFGYYAILYNDNQTVHEAGSCLLAFITLADIYTNYLCILVSFNCFHKIYVFMCSTCDNKCKICCIRYLTKKRQIPSISPGVITPVDGGESTKSSTYKFNQSVQSVDDDDDDVNDENSNECVYQRNRENEYEQIDTEAQEDSVV